MSEAVHDNDQIEAARVFSEHRRTLIGVAYRILGSVADAEDVAQEAWLRWDDHHSPDIVDARAYLIRITARLALDRLRRLKARRESYIGPWLPEPVLTDPDAAEHVELAESVSMALLVVLETLSPLERAVFVLREAFALPYSEIAATLDRTETAVRQIARRARDHVEGRRPRYDTDQATHRHATERFLAACQTADFAALMALLAPDVTLISDSGGQARAPRRPVLGATRIARLLTSEAASRVPDLRYRPAQLNDGPGIVVTSQGRPIAALILDLADGLIRTIHAIGNPDKLTRIHADDSASI